MGFGGTAKKLQTMVDTAEKLYDRVQEVRDTLLDTKETVEDTNERVATLETELAAQQAVLDALAEREGVDVDAVREAARERGEERTAGEDG